MYPPTHYFARLIAHTKYLTGPVSESRFEFWIYRIGNRIAKQCHTAVNIFVYVCSSLRSSQISRHTEATERIITDFTPDELLVFPISARSCCPNNSMACMNKYNSLIVSLDCHYTYLLFNKRLNTWAEKSGK
jgi:hypothetical protein